MDILARFCNIKSLSTCFYYLFLFEQFHTIKAALRWRRCISAQKDTAWPDFHREQHCRTQRKTFSFSGEGRILSL
jgi:hypothetical protein